MTFAKKLTFMLLLVAGFTFSAQAQDALAKFTLAQSAYWGKTLLQPGEFMISVDLNGITKATVTSLDGKRVAFMAVPVTTAYGSCRETALSLVPDAGEYSVRSVCFAGSNVLLSFASERSKTSLAALVPETAIAGSR